MFIHPREHIAARLTGGDPGEPDGAFAQVVEALGRLDDVLAPFEWELLASAPDELLLMLANAASELGRLESGDFPFDWRFEPATLLVQLLHAADLPAAAARLLASVVDWQGDTPGERAKRLRARLQSASLEWRSHAVGLLARLLAMADQEAKALKLYEDDLDVEQSEDLPRQLQLRLDALSFEDGLALVVPLAGLCVVARGMATTAAVLEAYLDLSPEGYSVENVWRGLEARGWTGDPAQPAQLLNLAAWANQDIGRGSEADVLIDALLEAQDVNAGPPRGGPLEQLIARLVSLRDALEASFPPALAAPALGTTLALIPNRLDPPSLLHVTLRVTAGALPQRREVHRLARPVRGRRPHRPREWPPRGGGAAIVVLGAAHDCADKQVQQFSKSVEQILAAQRDIEPALKRARDIRRQASNSWLHHSCQMLAFSLGGISTSRCRHDQLPAA